MYTEKALLRKLETLYKKDRAVIYQLAGKMGYKTTQSVVHWITRKSIPTKRLDKAAKIVERLTK